MVERSARLLAVLAAACPYPWCQEFNPCKPLRKQHTQRHNAKLTSFRRRREILHWTRHVKIWQKNKLKEQGNERRNRFNDQYYWQRSVLFQRNKILRHAGSFNILCLLMFQHGDAKANGNEILNKSNPGVFGLVPTTTKKSFHGDEEEAKVRYGSKSHAGACKPWRNIPAPKICSSCQLLSSLTPFKYTGWHNMKCYMNELFTPIFKEKRWCKNLTCTCN